MKWGVALLPLVLIACSSVSPPCEQMQYTSSSALNVVLFNDGFTSQEFTDHAMYVRSTILSQEPFISKPYMNFYMVDNEDATICSEGDIEEVIGGSPDNPLPPLNCDVVRVQELVQSCNVPRAKLIILTNETVAAQASITYDESGVMFLDMKNQPPEIIQHEFGHLFGLVDEKANLVSFAEGPGRDLAPNCARSRGAAEHAWRDFYGSDHVFLQGCAGNENWYKPEHPTLMSKFPDPSWSYGTFNEWYLGMAMECCYGRGRAACDEFFTEYPLWDSCRNH